MSDDKLQQLIYKALKTSNPERLRDGLRQNDDIKAIKAKLGPQTKEELWEVIRDRIGVELSTVAVCPGHTCQLDMVWEVYSFAVRNVLWVMSRGGGKCLPGSALVYDVETGREVPIETLCDGRSLRVASMDESGHIVAADAYGEPNIEKPCVTISMSNGRSITLSDDHPVLLAEGWRHSGKVRVGDRLAMPASLPEPDWLVPYGDAELDLLALLLAEGGYTGQSVMFTNADPSLVEIARTAVESFGCKLVHSQSYDYRIAYHKSVKNPVREMLDRAGLGQTLAKHKRAPKLLFQAPDAQVERFLQLFWMCDGYVNHNSPEITLASRGLIEDLRLLLLRLGIQSSVRHRSTGDYESWCLTIRSSSFRRFHSRLRLWGHKGDKMGEIVARKPNANKGRPVIPEGFLGEIDAALQGLSRDDRRERGYEFAEVHGANRRPLSCDALIQSGRKTTSAERLAGMVELLPEIDLSVHSYLWSSDLWWDEVVAVEDAGVQQTYDLCVPEHQNFVADGLIAHNTSLAAWMDGIQAEYWPGWASFSIGATSTQGDRKYEYLLPMVVEGGVIGGKELSHVIRSTSTVTQYKNGSKNEIALGGCLPYRGKVITRDGPLEIGKIVENKMPVEVRSYDFEKECWVWSRVVDWHYNGDMPHADGWLRLKYDFGPGGPSHATMTLRHRVMRPDGTKTEARDLKIGDEVCVEGIKFSHEQEQVMMGTLLGDGSLLNTSTLSVSHCDRQAYYLDWFDDAFSELEPNRSKRESRNDQTSRYRVCRRTRELRNEWYPEGVKRIPDHVWSDLDLLGLAVWIMDDGRFVKGPNSQRGIWEIAALHFNEHERSMATDMFERMDIYGEWRAYDVAKNQYLWLCGADSATSLTALLMPYIDVSVKQPKGWKRWVADPITEHSHHALLVAHVEMLEVLEHVPGKNSSRKNGEKYDITVEGTHNYTTSQGLLISNTPESANGPRVPRLHRDETELMRNDTYKQAANIPAGRKMRDGRYAPAQWLDTSTMKGAEGRIDKAIQAYNKTLELGQRPTQEVRICCIYESAAENPACSSVPEEERRARLIELGRDPDELCDCLTYTSDVWPAEDDADSDAEPEIRTLQSVCQGRFFRSRGHKEFSDIQGLFQANDRETWNAEQECAQPSTEGAYIRSYNQVRNGIKGYEPDPENGPIYQAIDWGSADEAWIGWFQMLERPVRVRAYKGDGVRTLPVGALVVFAEIFRAGLAPGELALLVIEKEHEWVQQWPGWRVEERYPDSADLGARQTWKVFHGLTTTSRIKKDFINELKMVRRRVGAKGGLYVDINGAPWFDKSIRAWKQVNGREVHDFACLPGDTLVATEDCWRRIDEIKAGELVWTRAGLERVIWSGLTKTDATVVVEHEHGKLECTADHRVWTQRGWVQAQHLTSTDTILLCGLNGKSGLESTAPARVLRVRTGRPAVPVYDLHVENHHEFIADGVLVHNSHAMAGFRYLEHNLDVVAKKLARAGNSQSAPAAAADGGDRSAERELELADMGLKQAKSGLEFGQVEVLGAVKEDFHGESRGDVGAEDSPVRRGGLTMGSERDWRATFRP